jgi:hypothetical protein
MIIFLLEFFQAFLGGGEPGIDLQSLFMILYGLLNL